MVQKTNQNVTQKYYNSLYSSDLIWYNMVYTVMFTINGEEKTEHSLQ